MSRRLSLWLGLMLLLVYSAAFAAETGSVSGTVRSSDGAYLLGVMNRHTANAGRVYFPAGTPDPDDIVGARVDLDGSTPAA